MYKGVTFDELLNWCPISAPAAPTEKDCFAFERVWIVRGVPGIPKEIYYQSSQDINKPKWIKYENNSLT